jgi:Fe-S cluster assembly protein SufD
MARSETPMTEAGADRTVFLKQFTQLEREAPAGQSAWILGLRRAAIERFAELGFPTTKDENWKYTNVEPIAHVPFRLAPRELNGLTAADLKPFTFEGFACHQLVFVNGRFAPGLSALGRLPAGARIGSLAAAISEEPRKVEAHLARHAAFDSHPFVALNTAFLADGAFVYLPQDAILEEPIHLLFISTSRGEAIVTHPRSLIVLGDHSQATLLESYAGTGKDVYFTNAVTEILAGPNTVVDHYKLQREGEEAFHIATLQARLDRSSSFTTHSISLGGVLTRNDVNAVLDAEGAEGVLNGLYLAGDRQHVDNHTRIDHARPHCSSRELYKGVLADRARGVFNGQVVVRKDAQKTDAKQTNKNLLLSEEAQIDTKPQLEIYADDVKCTHGATVGQLDEDALFYLRSRGLDGESARRLLIYAFAGDIVNRVKVEPVRAGLDRLVSGWLPQSRPAGRLS